MYSRSSHAGGGAPARIAAGAACLVSALAAPLAAQPIYFAEPYSGRKVVEYRVELPVARDERRSFQIPGDCPALLDASASGAAQWGSRVERNVWWKVESDCRYHQFLHRHDGETMADYVSDYDFMNAYLRDLPMGARCSYPGADPTDPKCQPLPPGIPGVANFLPFADRGPTTPKLDVEPCRLENGIFRGRIVRDASGLHCEPDDEAPGFRVISADYADVNGDRILDVVLRLIPLAPGASRMPVILPLTRTSSDAGFTIPPEVAVPRGASSP